jgi:hypothetical protein
MAISAKGIRPLLAAAGYRDADLVEGYRFTYRASDNSLRNRPTIMVAFGGSPHTMRTACVGVIQVDANESIAEALLQLRYLTAPFAFIGQQGQIGLYEVAKTATDSPIYAAPDGTDLLASFESRLSALTPNILNQAKQDSIQLQLGSGISSWAEEVTAQTLTTLLEQLLRDAIRLLPRRDRNSPSAIEAIVRLVFHLFAARVLEDKDIIPESSSAFDALGNAHARFSENIDPGVLRSEYVSDDLVERVQAQLHDRFAFASLTTEMLGHAYENTLVTPELRRQRGIYYTPQRLTRHVLAMLPIESLPLSKRVILDPCCGSGSFLVQGMERLSGLAPKDWSSSELHAYLRRSLIGRDVDDLAREIATLSLMLADIENRNGWDIAAADVNQLLVRGLPRAPAIIVTNPPFGETKDKVRRERASEVLTKCIELLANGGLLGIVLPLSFLDSNVSAPAREFALRKLEILELDILPGRIFGSGADTAVLLARKPAGNVTRLASPTVTVRELRSRDVAKFNPPAGFSLTYSADPDDWLQSPGKKFLVSPLMHVWRRLETECFTIDQVATLRNGLQVDKSDTTSVSSQERAGSVKYVDRLSLLRPYALLSTKSLDYGPHLRRTADVNVFKARKVLVNATRNPGSAWRLIAAVASKDVYFSDHFHGIVPTKKSITAEQVTAVINSPVANAWFDAHCRSRKVVLSILRQLPWPRTDLSSEVTALVKQLEQTVRAKWRGSGDALFYDALVDTSAILQVRERVDQLVYEAYGLGREEAAQINRVMALDRRPN